MCPLPDTHRPRQPQRSADPHGVGIGQDSPVADESEILEALVSEENLDGLLAVVSLDDIATAWCRCQSAAHSEDESEHPDRWAIDLFFTSELFRRPELYRSLLLKLVEHADDSALGQISAGPLEDFVSDDPDDLVWLEFQCASNPKLRTALAGVWCSNDVEPATLERLDAAAGVKLARLVARG
jgi:hypothetical protein